jgi:hypothetical protein
MYGTGRIERGWGYALNELEVYGPAAADATPLPKATPTAKATPHAKTSLVPLKK